MWSDNIQNDENLLATGCGTTAPAVVIAPRNVITARFQSSETPGKGFSAAFYISVYHMLGLFFTVFLPMSIIQVMYLLHIIF